MKSDVIILGAGAAGLMCALTAAGRGRTVTVLEHKGRVAGKLRVSGGGRCNFTNLDISSDHYVSRNPAFVKSALARFTPHDFIRMLDTHGIRHKEKEQGQLFCADGASAIVRMLQDGCVDAGAKIHLNCRIDRVSREGLFVVETKRATATSSSFVIATGGMSWPALGATDLGYRIAREFGLDIIPPRPGLVPLTLHRTDREFFSGLSGVSFRAVVKCGRQEAHGDVLFTHRGLSGPAILDISLHWTPGVHLSLNILPGIDAYDLLSFHRGSRMKIETLLSRHLPAHFAKLWCIREVASKPLNHYNDRDLKEIAAALGDWRITPAGTEGYDKAEVTVGGVNTAELSSKTMEAKKVPGLYFIGEVVDVTGRLGGYNLQWAWSSGYAAGQHV